MLTENILSLNWSVTTSLSNNKTDRYVVTAVELMKFINKQRRISRRKRRHNDDDIIVIKDIHPLDTWLIDLILKKTEEHVKQFKMENAEITKVCLKRVKT